MQKIVINRCYGGFGLSDEATDLFYKKKGITTEGSLLDINRDDPDLISIVEELGKSANGYFSELKIVEIPDDVDWQIKEYDGIEWVVECHRTWR